MVALAEHNAAMGDRLGITLAQASAMIVHAAELREQMMMHEYKGSFLDFAKASFHFEK